jgi:hypothetical protein
MTTNNPNEPAPTSATAPWRRFPAAAYLLTLAAEHLRDDAPSARDKFIADALVSRTSTALGVEELPFCAALAEILNADAEEQADHCRLVRGDDTASGPALRLIAEIRADLNVLERQIVEPARADMPTLPDLGAVKETSR